MHKVFSWLKKHKQPVRYVIFGILTTVVSLGIYQLCTLSVLDPQIPVQLAVANFLSWIGAVSFAYITNRKYVFESRNEHKIKEAFSFLLSRVSTLLIDLACMHILVQWIKIDDRIAKLLVQFIIVISNYILSRFLVFRRPEATSRNKKSGTAVRMKP